LVLTYRLLHYRPAAAPAILVCTGALLPRSRTAFDSLSFAHAAHSAARYTYTTFITTWCLVCLLLPFARFTTHARASPRFRSVHSAYPPCPFTHRTLRAHEPPRATHYTTTPPHTYCGHRLPHILRLPGLAAYAWHPLSTRCTATSRRTRAAWAVSLTPTTPLLKLPARLRFGACPLRWFGCRFHPTPTLRCLPVHSTTLPSTLRYRWRLQRLDLLVPLPLRWPLELEHLVTLPVLVTRCLPV